MEFIFVLLVVLQSMAISLGVGSSTLAIINFFIAIADGTIDPQERKLMGVVYIVLRIAMVTILITTLFVGIILITNSTLPYFSSFAGALWTLVAVLFLNAFLMTKHIMPSKVGPALQAATWYTLGIITALSSVGIDDFSYVTFLIGYIAAVALAVGTVNAIMSYLKKKESGS